MVNRLFVFDGVGVRQHFIEYGFKRRFLLKWVYPKPTVRLHH